MINWRTTETSLVKKEHHDQLEDHRRDQSGGEEHHDQLEDHRRDRPGKEGYHDQLEVHSEGQTNDEQNDHLDMENQLVKEEQFDQRQDKSEDKQNKFGNRAVEAKRPENEVVGAYKN